MAKFLSVKIFPVSNLYAVRQPVLRPGKPLQECMFEGETAKDTIHPGAFRNERLIAVAASLENNHKYFREKKIIPVKGMAVFDEKKEKVRELYCEKRENSIC